MIRTKGNGDGDEPQSNLDHDLDALFQLPLTEFTTARNALASGLKKAGRREDAERVRNFVKPSISAWAVNRIYRKHRSAFDELISAGKRLASAHAAQLSGKSADTHEPLAARRQALAKLSRFAEALLREAGHNPTADTLHRINTTLEALSIDSSSSGAPPGRLTADIPPPGFQPLEALIAVGRAEPSNKSKVLAFPPRAAAGLAPAKAALKAAELTLRQKQNVAKNAAAALKKGTAQAEEAEKARRRAAEHLEKATVIANEARQQVDRLSAEAEKAARALEDAQRIVKETRKELDCG